MSLRSVLHSMLVVSVATLHVATLSLASAFLWSGCAPQRSMRGAPSKTDNKIHEWMEIFFCSYGIGVHAIAEAGGRGEASGKERGADGRTGGRVDRQPDKQPKKT